MSCSLKAPGSFFRGRNSETQFRHVTPTFDKYRFGVKDSRHERQTDLNGMYLERVTKPSQDSQGTLKPGATRLTCGLPTIRSVVNWAGQIMHLYCPPRPGKPKLYMPSLRATPPAANIDALQGFSVEMTPSRTNKLSNV